MFKERWKQVVFKIASVGMSSNDRIIKEFASAAMKIPDEIKDYAAKRWIGSCMVIHSIAFLEWRKIYRGKDTSG